MIASKVFNKPKRTLSRDATLKPLTRWFGFAGIITLAIKGKYDCEQSKLYFRMVRKMGVLQNYINNFKYAFLLEYYNTINISLLGNHKRLNIVYNFKEILDNSGATLANYNISNEAKDEFKTLVRSTLEEHSFSDKEVEELMYIFTNKVNNYKKQKKQNIVKKIKATILKIIPKSIIEAKRIKIMHKVKCNAFLELDKLEHDKNSFDLDLEKIKKVITS